MQQVQGDLRVLRVKRPSWRRRQVQDVLQRFPVPLGEHEDVPLWLLSTRILQGEGLFRVQDLPRYMLAVLGPADMHQVLHHENSGLPL